MRILKYFKSMKALSKRHEMPVMNSLAYELFVRLYERQFFRVIVKFMLKHKRPKKVDFVIGSYNSGTTILKQVIAAHPDVCISPVEGDRLTNTIDKIESPYAPRAMIANVNDIFYEHSDKDIDSEQFISDLRPWIDNGKIFLEKSISNTVRIDRLRSAFSEARFVCVTRSVDAVTRGIIKRSSPSGLLQAILGVNEYPVSFLMRQWIMFYSCVLNDYAKRSDDIYFVSYERYLLSPVEETRNIFSFMGLVPVELTYENNILTVANKSLYIRQSDTESTNYLCTADDLMVEIDKVRARL